MVSGSEYMHMFLSTQSVHVFLVDTFNAFKVIIDMYDPITIFLTVLGLFFVFSFSVSV